ncbi:MAG: copper homeostasis protein CutC [Rhodothermales bacterium]
MSNAPQRVKLEICVESLAGALAAEAGGADRIELCSALSDGGLTPSIGLLERVMADCSLPVRVMIRPRGGSFVYSQRETEVMLADIERVVELGAEGIVTGCLNADGTVDETLSARLAQAAYPFSCTFHRAIDVSRDPLEAIDIIAELGYDHILTSGQAVSAPEGTALIGRMVAHANGRIEIMAGAGVRPENAAMLVGRTGVRSIHSSASVWIPDHGSTPARDPMGRRETSVELVRSLREAIGRHALNQIEQQ